MCEFCGCEEDTFNQRRVAGQKTGSTLRGIPVVAIGNSPEQHLTQNANLKSFTTTSVHCGCSPYLHRVILPRVR